MTADTDRDAARRQTDPLVRRHISAPLLLLAALAVLFPAITLAAGASLWRALDLSWLLLAAVALTHAIFRRSMQGGCGRTLLTLTVVLVVLYPIISPDDDLLLLILPADAQTVVADAAKQKHSAALPHVHALAAALASLLLAPPHSWYPVLEPQFSGSVITVAHATGNHSPPSC